MAGRGAQVALGKLTAVDPRTVWPNEALDFTPWLRENAALLGRALGLDVELTASEVSVGGFNVDIVGQDLTQGRKLIVENQLEQTDHGHLGQLLTYAGGLESAAIVWISPAFRDEHRQALDWLNAHTDETIDFFGLELEVLQIGSSEPAPNLRPVAMPNEWQHRAKAATTPDASPLMQSRQRFFDAVLKEFKRQYPGMTNAKQAPPGSWLSIAAGRAGFWFSWSFAGDGTFKVDLSIDAGDEAHNAALLAAILRRENEVATKLGDEPVWDRKPGRRSVRVYLYRAGSTRPDTDTDLIAWAVKTMGTFAQTFRPIVRTLEPERDESDEHPPAEPTL